LPFIKLQGVVEQSDKFNGWIIKQSFIKGEKVGRIFEAIFFLAFIDCPCAILHSPNDNLKPMPVPGIRVVRMAFYSFRPFDYRQADQWPVM
jgi:hypothetical protein